MAPWCYFFLLTCPKAPNLFCKCISKDRPRNFFLLSGVTNFQTPLSIACGHSSFHTTHSSGYCPCRFSLKSLSSSHLHGGNASILVFFIWQFMKLTRAWHPQFTCHWLKERHHPFPAVQDLDRHILPQELTTGQDLQHVMSGWPSQCQRLSFWT